MEDNKNIGTTTFNMSEEELKRVFASLESSNNGQEKYARLQFIMTMISAAASIIALCIVLYTVGNLIPRVDSLLTGVESTMSNVEKITDDLAKVDMQEMASDIDSLVATSEVSITEAMDKLNGIDFETLNKAIKELENVVRPISSLFGGGR